MPGRPDGASDALSYLPLALRPWAVAMGWERGPTPEGGPRPQHLLVADCETRLTPDQRLTFGSARLYRRADRRYQDDSEGWEWFSEYLFQDEAISAAERGELEAFVGSLPSVERFDPLWSPESQTFSTGGTRLRVNEQGVHTFLVTRDEFVRNVLRPFAIDARSLVVLFNAPFDLSRLARGWGEARGRRRRDDEQSAGNQRFDSFLGGFSLSMEEYVDARGVRHENAFAPRVAIKTIDSKRHLIALRKPRPAGSDDEADFAFAGNFLDVHTLAYALTNTNYSLRRACEAFGVESGKLDWEPTGTISDGEIAYNRQDVAATFALALKLLAEYDRHPVSPDAATPARRTLSETRAYSPASIGKAYLRAMGLRPVLERQPDFPDEVLGYAMTAFFGGRAECRIRRSPVPVVLTDYLSMYPTVNANMGLWRLLTAGEIRVEEATADVAAFLDGVTTEDLYDPETWRQLPALVQCLPGGEILPARAAFPTREDAVLSGSGDDWQIGVNPLWSETPLWYALPDLVAAKVLGGKAPRVLRALRLVAEGEQPNLRPVQLRGEVEVDPERADFFRTVVEERHRLRDRDLEPRERDRLSQFLKTFANSVSYGIFAEMVRHLLPVEERADVRVHGLLAEPTLAKVRAPETPGEYCFPPVAACITAAARLMLALLERAVLDAGGSYVFTDTDSMAILATEEGGLVSCPGGPFRDDQNREAVRALSYAEVDQIRERLNALKPYDESVRDDLLKLEAHNFDPRTGERCQLYAYAISAKRYALYNLTDQGWLPRRCSEHGLGHLLDPTRQPTTNPKADTTRVAELELVAEDGAEAEEETGLREWICDGWAWMIGDALGRSRTLPAWAAKPAVAQITASTPRVLDAFRGNVQGYDDRIKPFNFLLAAHVDRLRLTSVPVGQPFHLVAPYSSDPQQWLAMTWFDRYSGKPYPITTDDIAVVSVRVKSFVDILSEHRFRVERKSLAPDGGIVRRTTAGLLQRRPVRMLSITYIGKESNLLSERPTGLVQRASEVLTEYSDDRLGVWRLFIQPRLPGIPTQVIAAATGRNRSTVKRWKRGEQVPRPGDLETLRKLIVRRLA
jgi:hypothetical protein